MTAVRSAAIETPQLGSQHPAFQDDACDVIVVSDGQLGFPFRQSHLTTASADIEARLATEEFGWRRTASGLVLIVISHAPAEVERFLLFAHPQVENPTTTDVQELWRYAQLPMLQSGLARGC